MEPPHSILKMMKDYNALQLLKSVQEESNLWYGDLYAKPRKFDSLTRFVDENEQRLQSIQQELNAKPREFDSLTRLVDENEQLLQSIQQELNAKPGEFDCLTRLVDENEQRLQHIQQELNAKPREFDCLSQIGLIKERNYEVDGKEKRLREKDRDIENQVKDLESMEKFYQERANLCNKTSFTTNDAGNIKVLSNGPGLNHNGILINLKTAPNLAQLVLDIIRNTMIRREEGIVIEKTQIFLLDQLVRISPHIDPDVKYEAMKLALELKETVRGCTEDSLVVLGFLLVLSSYELFPHSNFNEDEVLKLFEVVAHHKEAVELFRTLGFVDKISDFVDNLIKNLRHIGAVRFIFAYNLVDKYRLVSIVMLQLEMQKAKEISYEVVRREKHREPKVKARDTEIATLKDILQCISDCNLENHHNLVGEIKKRILVLEQENQRENSVSIASDSESSSNEKKHARKAVSMNQVKEQQLAQKNQVRVQHREEKQPDCHW